GLFDAVVKWYSTPTTASLGRLVLPFLFPDLPSFPRVADLILHLRSLDAQLSSAAPDPALLTTNPPVISLRRGSLLSTRPLLPLHPRSQLLPLATKGARRAVRREEVVAVVGVVEGAVVEVVEGAVVEVVEGAVVGGGSGSGGGGGRGSGSGGGGGGGGSGGGGSGASQQQQSQQQQPQQQRQHQFQGQHQQTQQQ
ncbi:unnamed protein product, partial [Closterium sp. NIES-54]